MMRRGGRGSNVPVARTGHDDAISSTLHNLDRRWAVRRYVQVIVLAACSVAIAIIIWSLRPRLPQELSRPGGHNLQSQNGGFVLPLYHYYQQFPNSSRVVGGAHARWRGSGGVTGRGIRSHALGTLFNLHGGHREYDSEMEQFYIEMKLGDPPTPFYFHIDTGSGPTWVYCTDRGRPSSITDVGPHGMFDPPKGSYANCTGPTATLCRGFQAKLEKCSRRNNFECIFSAVYVDGSECEGLVVNGSITVPMRDKLESKVFGLFGTVKGGLEDIPGKEKGAFYSVLKEPYPCPCYRAVIRTLNKFPTIFMKQLPCEDGDEYTMNSCVVDKESGTSETLPLVTDGIIGLGNCPGTLLDQLSTSKAISQNVLGVCLAKDIPWPRTTLPAAQAVPVGYVSLGMGFDEKFDQSNSAWVKMIGLSPRIPCAYAIKLISITIGNKRISVHFKSLDRRIVGMPMGLDTGSDFAFLDNTLYDQVLRTLEVYYTTNGKYFRIDDNEYMPASEQRVCWEYRAGKRRQTGNRRMKASPIHDFRPIKLGFEGIGSGTGPAPNVQYLIIRPENYLTWAEDEMKVCVNILQDNSDYSVSNIGSQAMREHQFVFDIENQRVRWKLNSNCET